MSVTAKNQSSSVAARPFSAGNTNPLVDNFSSISSFNNIDSFDKAAVKVICRSHYTSFLYGRSQVSLVRQSATLHPQSGFTLIEILVVIVILSIFAGMMSLSVGNSESRKNRAFYEHLTDSLSYVRLLSAERMQPMGLSLQADKQGQVTPVIMTLSNPYVAYQTAGNAANSASNDSTAKNSMELSADLSAMSIADGDKALTPSWELESEVTLPELPVGVSLSIQSLETATDSGNISSVGSTAETRVLQPWFTAQTVPQVLWFGTGQATPVTIEVRHQSRLVGEVITIMPDGSITIGQGL